MIITCNNCNKKFDIDSTLIPDKGRLLQCASCDYKWFFKKEVLENIVSPIVQNNLSNNDEINPSDLLKEEAKAHIEDEIDKKIEINNEEEPKKKIDATIIENTTVKAKPKKQKNYKILNIFILAIISSVAIVIIIDTFKYPIGQVVPNIEFMLYNLYESIKDISLFIRDLT